MAITVDVPTSLPFSRAQELVRAFGLELHDLVSFELHTGCVTAVVYAKNEDGKLYIGADNEAAKHTISIPFDRTQ